jgi:hypothetical protein
MGHGKVGWDSSALCGRSREDLWEEKAVEQDREDIIYFTNINKGKEWAEFRKL